MEKNKSKNDLSYFREFIGLQDIFVVVVVVGYLLISNPVSFFLTHLNLLNILLSVKAAKEQ